MADRGRWKKLFPKLTNADFDKVWEKIDANGDGNLSCDELAKYYGFNMSPSSVRKGQEAMTDEQIMEALAMAGTLHDMEVSRSPPFVTRPPPRANRRRDAFGLAA